MEEINKWLLDPSTNHPSYRGEIGLWGRLYGAQKSGRNVYEQHPNRCGRRPLKYPTPKTSRWGSNGHFLGTPCPRGSGPHVHGVSREVTHHPVCTGVRTPCPWGPVSMVHPVPTRYPESPMQETEICVTFSYELRFRRSCAHFKAMDKPKVLTYRTTQDQQ